MTNLQIVLTCADILALVVVLLYFLNRIARQLNSISATLGKITFGVRAVETQCAVIGPAADVINANLAKAAAGLSRSADIAQTIGR
ncbi:MAG: hypothetical protein ACRDY2_11555 [Acidimicrobiales bacterium]